MNQTARKTIDAFHQRFGEKPVWIVRAPGRVNLIGEHTDYNDGYVLPMAIDQATWIALRPRTSRQVQLYSLDHVAACSFSLESIERDRMHWSEYPKGVAHTLLAHGYPLSGWEGVTACDIPMGAGLSSSASFELAVARAFSAVSGFAWDKQLMARLCQQAENQWVGVKCGIMDQMISAIGEEGKAILIDCRDYAHRAVPLPTGVMVVIMDTMTRRGLVESVYNERRQQCQEAAKIFGVKALRDADLDTYKQQATLLNPITRRRAKHVVTENHRTLNTAAAMERGDATTCGRLMNESHKSLRDDFEVTNDALNAIVAAAQSHPGCLGARMTGAGFGGCAVALVETSKVESFSQDIVEAYQRSSQLTPNLYPANASKGASIESTISLPP